VVVKQLHLDICTQNAIQLQKFELISIPQKKNKNNGEIRGSLRKISPNLKIICIFAALKRI
jgi:hypothetical protein